MERLEHDWLTEGIVDFEYKKYILLAYLKDIRKRFDKSELYPFLSDLIFHYRNLLKIRENKEVLYKEFPKRISKADFAKLRLSYKMLSEDDETMIQIEDIISYAIPKINEEIRIGRELYEFVQENMAINPVGITPLYSQEGYFFLQVNASHDISIYRYNVTFFESAEEKYKGVSTTFIASDCVKLSRSYEHIKLELTKTYRELPNPATYLIESKLRIPIAETLLPVAKRILIQTIPN